MTFGVINELDGLTLRILKWSVTLEEDERTITKYFYDIDMLEDFTSVLDGDYTITTLLVEHIMPLDGKRVTSYKEAEDMVVSAATAENKHDEKKGDNHAKENK